MINTGVPNSLNRPQTFHTFTFLRASGSLISVPLRLALIGAKLTTGATATVNTVYDLTGMASTETDALFGASAISRHPLPNAARRSPARFAKCRSRRRYPVEQSQTEIA